MKTTFTLISTITLMLAACSHNKSTHDVFRQADRLISVMPDSAVTMQTQECLLHIPMIVFASPYPVNNTIIPQIPGFSNFFLNVFS
ncbi:MAG: hypothetical protein K2K37_01800 [Muribaculaceae bacterium]|nr:hypothetical protein [Muribaculaceae bacterium]